MTVSRPFFRTHFRQMLRERRAFPVGSPDWEYRTRAAMKYLWIMRGVPNNQWSFP